MMIYNFVYDRITNASYNVKIYVTLHADLHILRKLYFTGIHEVLCINKSLY